MGSLRSLRRTSRDISKPEKKIETIEIPLPGTQSAKYWTISFVDSKTITYSSGCNPNSSAYTYVIHNDGAYVTTTWTSNTISISNSDVDLGIKI